MTVSRIVSSALALILGANGLAMLFAGLWWYGSVPGVTATGPFNPHFVRDIGAIYMVCAGSLAAFAWRPDVARPALAAMAAFLTLHVCVHIFDALCGTRPLQDTIRDFAGVYLPALICLALVIPRPSRVAPAALAA
jgi:hypothetical protein